MKKSVLALAVLGAFAGVASAQSSVTLFGVVDLNVRYVNNDQTTYSLSQDGMSSSRLGFRGVEDLGGGLKASFWLEAAIGPDTGRGGGSFGNGTQSVQVPCYTPPGAPLCTPTTVTVSENPFLFQRRSTLSLSNAWGELRMGRDYTPQFWSWTVFDPFGTNGVGSATNLALQANLFAGSGGSYGTLVRANNSVQYILPNGVFGPGLYGQFMMAAGENAIGNKMWGGRIGYAAGPFDVAFAYSDTDVSPDASGTNWNIGGSWNFGFMKLSGFYSKIDISGSLNGVNFADRGQQNWFIGGSVPFGQANFKISWGQSDGTGAASIGAKQWALGADYNLSKRTAIYATWASINNNSGSAFRVAPTSVLTPGTNSSGFEVGARHIF
jgi:predicted porin